MNNGERLLYNQILRHKAEIEDLKENNRLLESGSKQLCDEIKLLIKDSEELQRKLDIAWDNITHQP